MTVRVAKVEVPLPPRRVGRRHFRRHRGGSGAAEHGIDVVYPQHHPSPPTVFRSPLTAWMFEDTQKAIEVRAGFMARVPMGRLGEPEDLAGPLLFLASRASSSPRRSGTART